MVRHIGIVRQFCAISEATYIFLQCNELGRVVSAFIQVYLFIAYIIINKQIGILKMKIKSK